jgi:uncharacterized membrane protein YraQ (UPF0718 family)
MEKISTAIDKKTNHLIGVLVANAIFLLILAVLIVWTDFMLRLVMGLVAVIIAGVFLYTAYKLRHFREALDKYIKF